MSEERRVWAWMCFRDASGREYRKALTGQETDRDIIRMQKTGYRLMQLIDLTAVSE